MPLAEMETGNEAMPLAVMETGNEAMPLAGLGTGSEAMPLAGTQPQDIASANSGHNPTPPTEQVTRAANLTHHQVCHQAVEPQVR